MSYRCTCQYKECGAIFYTSTSRSRYCSDNHRLKAFEARHEKEIAHLKNYTKGFNANVKGLKHLFGLGYLKPTKKELIIAGIDITIIGKVKKTKDGRPCHIYNEFVLILTTPDGLSFEIDKTN